MDALEETNHGSGELNAGGGDSSPNQTLLTSTSQRESWLTESFYVFGEQAPETTFEGPSIG